MKFIDKVVIAFDNIKEFYDTNQIDRLNTMQREGLAESEILDGFHLLSKKGIKLIAMVGMEQQMKRLLAFAYQLPT